MIYLIVQVTTDEVLFARFRKKGSALVFLEAGRESLNDQRSLGNLLQEIKAKSKEEEKVVLSLPPALLFMREVELPISDRRKVREVLPLEMKGETAIDTDNLMFDALALEGGKFLAIWAKRKELLEHIRLLAEHGLEPEIVTASLFHWQALIPDKTQSAPFALSDGESLTVYHQGLPVYFRSLGHGEASQELAKSLAALQMVKGIEVRQVHLHGKAARQAAAGDFSRADIDFIPLPVAGALAQNFPVDAAAARDLAGTFALAQACSTQEPINFRRGDLAYTAGLAKAQKKLRVTMFLAAMLVLLLFAEVGLRFFLVNRDLVSLNKSVNSMYREIFPSRKKAVDEVAEVRSEIKRMSGPGAASSLLPILKKIAEIKGDDIIVIYEAEIEGGQVRLKGDARSAQAANDFKTRASAVFTGAELGEIKSRPDGSVSFTFKAASKGVK